MKKFILKYTVRFTMILMTIFLSFNSGFAKEPDSMNRSRIKPTIASLEPGAEQQFYVVKEPARLAAAFATNKVSWYVNGIIGGNITVGTITKEGIYRAPANAPESPEIHISVTVDNSSNRTLWATVLYNGKRPLYKTVSEWGESKDSLKHLKDPMAIIQKPGGNFLIADGKIKHFSNEGVFIEEMGESRGDYEGSLVDPLNLAINNKGLIFVSDKRTGPPRIQVFTQEGRYIFGFAPKGISAGRVMDTRGMAFNSKQQLYIGDFDNMRVSVFDHTGEFIQNIGKKGAFPGELNLPYGLAIDPNDDLFIVNYFGPCQKFTPDGHFLCAFAYADPSHGPIYFTDVASDRWGNIYLIAKGVQISEGEYEAVKDENGNRVDIMKYNNNGDFIANIQLSKADRDARRLYVDESGRILVIFNGKDKIGVEVLGTD